MMKMFYLSVDGGGTKLNALWFSDKLELIGSAKSAGVNPTVYTYDVIASNIKKCYKEMFSDISEYIEIECMYVICGSADLYIRYLPQNIKVKHIVNLGEALAGLVCGCGKLTGFVAVSGTGSDVFYVRDSITHGFVGGWGAILGDEGSGVWMARQAMQAAIRYNDGWRDKTILPEIICSELGLKNLRELIDYLYEVSERFYRLGQLLPIVAKAANCGDCEALNVFRRGGIMMAKQIITIIERHPDVSPDVMICGGAWKSHPVFFETCKDELHRYNDNINLMKPWFEHVMAGAAYMLMQNGFDSEYIENALKANFSDYIWRMKK